MTLPADKAPDHTPCGRVVGVARESPASNAGFRVGDCLYAVNGQPVRDLIDVQFHASDSHLRFLVSRGGKSTILSGSRRPEEDLGLSFEYPLFDGIRECNNHCPFCFVRNLPPGLRPSLYIHDDDFRLSFLHGSYVTLTNLLPDDWSRLREQRLSPLYISVHATDSRLREKLLGRKKTEPILDSLRRLAGWGITLHTQIVVLPGWNDAGALDQTIEDLVTMVPHVASIGVVPVGLTSHCHSRLRRPGRVEARAVIEQVAEWQVQLRRDHGMGIAYAADEWFLLAGQDVPPADYYDAFPQLENGIGLVRRWLEECDAVVDQVSHGMSQEAPVYCVTGTLFAPIMHDFIANLQTKAATSVDVLAVPNRLFGSQVTVAGLLSGEDVIDSVRDKILSQVILPRNMFDSEGMRTLDEWTLPALEREIGAPVCVAEGPTELLRALGLLRRPPQRKGLRDWSTSRRLDSHRRCLDPHANEKMD